jgi:hypothetical protein
VIGAVKVTVTQGCVALAGQTKNASATVDEAHPAGLDGSHPVTLQAKMLRLELLKVKADLERRTRPTRPSLLRLRPDGALGRWS